MSKRKEDKKDRFPLRKVATRFVLLFIFFAAASSLYINRDNLTPNNIVEWAQEIVAGSGSGDGFPVTVAKSSTVDFKGMGDNSAVLSKTSFLILSSAGKELAHRQHGFSNPIMKVNKRKALIYDSGGHDIKIESRVKTLAPFKFDNKILTAAIGADNTVAVVTDSNTYIAEMTVFRQDFFSDNYTEIYKWYSWDLYIVDVAVAPDGKSAAVAAVSTDLGEIKSVVLVFDFNKSKPIGRKEYPGTLLLSVCYTGRNTIAVIGDNLASTISTDGSTIEEKIYTGKNLSCFFSDGLSGAALVLSESAQQAGSTLDIINLKGEITASVYIDSVVRYVTRNKDYIAVFTPAQLMVYNESGSLIDTIDCGADAAFAVISKNKVLVAGTSEIRQYSIKQ